MNEHTLEAQLRREREAISAMQYRQRRWLGPVLGILWRKPWRSPVPFDWTPGWLRAAHDCSDPSIACSCQGGFRFPKWE